MEFEPKTDEQLDMEGLLLPGTYDAEVIESEEQQSKSGNDMIKLKLQVWREDGSTVHVYDYILPAFARKLKHFCYSAGLEKQYDAGKVTATDCYGKAVSAMIDREKQEGYKPKNVVLDYMPISTGEQPAKEKDEDLPF